MSGPTLNQNFTSVREPHLKDLLDLFKKQSDLDFNCHHLGTIQAFNSTNQTVIVTINYKQTYFVFDPDSTQYVSKTLDYPILADCPLVVVGGGPVRLTFPVAVGDQCLVLFNDRDIDNWFQGSLASENASARLHSFSDAIALIGPSNKSSAITNYDAVRAIITNGTVKNGINPLTNKLTLTNGTSLSSLLQNLCYQIQNLTIALALLTVTGVTPGSPTQTSGVPSNASEILSLGDTIAGIATQIATLIE